MGDKSKIEWTEASWNPLAGCSRVSSGCDHCYAIGQAVRIQAMGNTDAYDGTTRKRKSGSHDWSGVIRLLPERLSRALRWKRPRRIFVNSMSDLFHPGVPPEYIDKVFAVMALAKQHTFQVLTKRPERMADYLTNSRVRHNIQDALFADDMYDGVYMNTLPEDRTGARWPLPNVWLGTSVEDQQTANERIPHLLRCPAAVRWLSCEPLLGPVDLRDHFGYCLDCDALLFDHRRDDFSGYHEEPGIHWVVTGGESGPGARPMHPDWVRALRGACLDANVAFFFKQWGAWRPGVGDLSAFTRRERHEFEDGNWMVRAGKKQAGRTLDGRTWDEYPLHETAPKPVGDPA